jgi:hypothetical protein
MKTQTLLIQLILAFSLISVPQLSLGQKYLTLVSNNKSNYQIVVSKKLGSPDQHSSEEILQTYIAKITGVKLPIVSSGKNENKKESIILSILNEMNPNELNIKVQGENILISAGSQKSLSYGVYEFLEKYAGCKWYAPNAEKVPKTPTLEIPNELDYTYLPQVTTRTVHSRLFYENPNFAEKHKVTDVSFPYYVPSAKVHTFHKFIPEEVFYTSNPELYALRGDKRLPTQLCLTNDMVYQIVRDSVASLFLQYPQASVISVSQDDNQQYCTCELCSEIDKAEGSHAGTMIRFVNKIAADFPVKKISTLAYQYTRKPPRTKALDNVLITLCSTECDRSGPIEEKCVDFANDLKGWKNIAQNIRIWDYTTQFTNYLAPFPNLRTLQPNIQFFRDNNAKWIFEQHSSQPSELFELRSYITAKLLWNPDLDFLELVAEFTDGYYEEAGIHVRKYIEHIHEKLAEDPDFFLFLYGDPSQAFDSFLSADLLEKYDSYFDDAEKAVAHKPVVLQRVREARLSTDYAILEACKKSISQFYSLVLINNEGGKYINPAAVESLERFYKTCKDAEITFMNEMQFSVQEYYDNYKQTMQVAIRPNKAVGKKVTLLTQPKKYAKEDPQVLTDGALGGNSFYANWLGFEGNNLEAIIDLEAFQDISSISMAFLKVTNHVVFFPEKVIYAYSQDGVKYTTFGTIENDNPLTKTSKVNEIKYFELSFPKVKAKYIKIVAQNMGEPPYWHHAAGTNAWIFADEVIIN